MIKNLTILTTLTLLLLGCGGDPATGPVEITWDRDNCSRCVMALSDRRHGAQIRGGERHQAYTFDDIGCAVLWLETQSWKSDPATEIWVNDFDSTKGDNKWVEARSAKYIRITHTPMNYGFSAINSMDDSSPYSSEQTIYNFTQMREAVFKQEEEFNASVKARLNHRNSEAAE
ncbi:MAG: hypothetical protein HOM84_05195 [Thiotrichales bacterium]|jgi:nitrous oxide reductase accessory protein NosL|nr:hypothetical protein [Thiotrichales bacterium]MBT3613042.1 hypothetical protein [Thiotrichales bacterium]MBT3751944.1 hypothetical protein [Thiotrichales bacterium]MBT3837648.1 hypothetical protein [Thiotrichales bacterium]MBT4152314.1 hypothetical protein [Thiotrichales bacterium]